MRHFANLRGYWLIIIVELEEQKDAMDSWLIEMSYKSIRGFISNSFWIALTNIDFLIVFHFLGLDSKLERRVRSRLIKLLEFFIGLTRWFTLIFSLWKSYIFQSYKNNRLVICKSYLTGSSSKMNFFMIKLIVELNE